MARIVHDGVHVESDDTERTDVDQIFEDLVANPLSEYEDFSFGPEPVEHVQLWAGQRIVVPNSYHGH